MIYALKLLFFVLVAGVLASAFLRPAFKELLTSQQYKRAWLALLVVTCITFLSMQPAPFFALIAVVALVASRYLGRGNDGYVNAFLLFLLPLPPINDVLGGLEGANFILLLDPRRLLSIVLLTAPAIRLLIRRRERNETSLRSMDIAMLLIQIWSWMLMVQSASLTGMARTLTISMYDVLIPYYVVTRTLRTPAQLREAASYLMLGLVFMASVACVESVMQRNLYAGLQWVYGVRWDLTPNLRRGDFLRVESSAGGGPIILGVCMVFGMALWAWLGGQWTRNKKTYVIYLVLGFALVSSWSRGPWLGAVLLAIAYVLQRWLTPRAFASTVVLVIAAAVLVKVSGDDQVFMSALGSIFGASESELNTIVYRRDLLDATIALIKQSPWTGVPNFERALESFRQGEGIIDIVNTYLTVMINGGVVGLVLFLTPYVLVFGRLLVVRNEGLRVSKAIFGNFAPVFAGLILTMLFVIFTVSNIGIIPYLLGLTIALPVGWLRQVRSDAAMNEEPVRAIHEANGLPLTVSGERALLRH